MPNAIESEKWLFELLRLLLETPVFTLSDLCVHDSRQGGDVSAKPKLGWDGVGSRQGNAGY